MKEVVKNVAKKKIKKWLLGILISMLPYIVIIVVVIGGISAVISFFKNLFSWGEKKSIDINNCTIEQLIEAVDDKSIFTNDMLKEMMIDRKSLKKILELVNEYNNLEEKKTISVEMNYVYYTTETKVIEIEVDESSSDSGSSSEGSSGSKTGGSGSSSSSSSSGSSSSSSSSGSSSSSSSSGSSSSSSSSGSSSSSSSSGSSSSSDSSGSSSGGSSSKKVIKKEITVTVEHKGVEAVSFEVDNNKILDAYDIDWQTVYIFCLYKSISNYSNWTYGGVAYDEDGNEVEIEPVTMKEDEIKAVLEDLKPKLTYQFNVVQDSRTKYSLAEAAAVFNIMTEFTISHKGVTKYYSGYVPKSVLSRADAPAFTDVYDWSSITGITTYSAEERFLKLGKQYNEHFDIKLFYTLLENLPGGKAVADKYRYIFSLPKWKWIL